MRPIAAAALHRPLTALRRCGLLLLLAAFSVACSGLPGAPAPTAPVATPTATAAPRHRLTPPRPLPTAAPFILRPSSTPLPTATAFDLDALLGQGVGPRNFPADVNPLTGLKAADPHLLERRPMAIKITNFPRSVRPQWGLTVADHIYEYYLEDGMTRFVGIFYGQDAERVGPIRSARPFDENLIRMYKAIFAFGYADDRVADPLFASELSPLLVIEKPNNCPPMCRIGPANAYNTLFTNTAQLSQYITERGVPNGRQNLDGLRFQEESTLKLSGQEVTVLAIRFSSTSYHRWEYDPLSRRYLRFQEAESRPRGEEVYAPLLDSLTGQPVAADNLIVLLLPAGYYFKSHSTEIYDFALRGRGKGFALREGRLYSIYWERQRPEDLVAVKLASGWSFPLKPGNVWFEVLSDTSTYETAANAWQFFFNLDLP